MRHLHLDRSRQRSYFTTNPGSSSPSSGGDTGEPLTSGCIAQPVKRLHRRRQRHCRVQLHLWMLQQLQPHLRRLPQAVAVRSCACRGGSRWRREAKLGAAGSGSTCAPAARGGKAKCKCK